VGRQTSKYSSAGDVIEEVHAGVPTYLDCPGQISIEPPRAPTNPKPLGQQGEKDIIGEMLRKVAKDLASLHLIGGDSH
jgi:hypothetical protein